MNKVNSPTIFCGVLSDLMRFWNASISPSDPTRRHKINRQSSKAMILAVINAILAITKRSLKKSGLQLGLNP